MVPSGSWSKGKRANSISPFLAFSHFSFSFFPSHPGSQSEHFHPGWARKDFQIGTTANINGNRSHNWEPSHRLRRRHVRGSNTMSLYSNPIGEENSMFEEIRELPSFLNHVENNTVRAGNSVKLTCQVKNLGNYKVAWVRVDTQTILTIHHHIITRNQRVSLSHHDHEIWRLHLENVAESDRGWYMCQINTDPMRSQKGYLEVVVPPKIVDSRSSSDVVVRENTAVNLTCEATGSPRPKLRWRRVDAKMIRYQGGMVVSVEGNSLVIPNAARAHIGKYYCIASNGVPPTVTKTIGLKVQFAPMVWVQNQYELVPIGYNITLQCNTESYPPAIHYWTFENGSAITSGSKFRSIEKSDDHITHTKLHINDVQQNDLGTYLCVAKNSLGQQDGAIKLKERVLPSTTLRHLPLDEKSEEVSTLSTSDMSEFDSADSANVFGYDPFVPGSSNINNGRHSGQKRKRTKYQNGYTADITNQYPSQQSANKYEEPPHHFPSSYDASTASGLIAFPKLLALLSFSRLIDLALI
ncbi:lachesin-like isoform X1 [Tigriopus californicus]|uniref:lachesin-like isoform X1 n=1 Tax=Tigriopus californicus TaxID=6832 RepID=UPI0027DA1631|nr:lachesin-like isoform X1 [Tigriopus californicus]